MFTQLCRSSDSQIIDYLESRECYPIRVADNDDYDIDIPFMLYDVILYLLNKISNWRILISRIVLCVEKHSSNKDGRKIIKEYVKRFDKIQLRTFSRSCRYDNALK